MRADLPTPGPLLVAHLLAPLDDLLVALLASLDDEEWNRPTSAGHWRVRDVVAHLVDGMVRKLVICRDGRSLPVAGEDPARDLVAFVDRLNADGVRFFGQLPPSVLVTLAGSVGRANAAFHAALDPMAPATFGVSWAGDARSANWFDTARELTERWHHQQQIRLAVRRPGAQTAEYLHPVLDCFMRALPHHYRSVEAPDATLVSVTVEGDGGGTWYLFRDDGTWRLATEPTGTHRTRVTIPADTAWRVFTKGIPRADAAARTHIHGDHALGEHVLQMTTIIG